METIHFKTNLKCGGCVSTITPNMEKLPAIESWKVDLESPNRELIVTAEHVDLAAVLQAVESAGYKIEALPAQS